jgi:hypothetical protein
VVLPVVELGAGVDPVVVGACVVPVVPGRPPAAKRVSYTLSPPSLSPLSFGRVLVVVDNPEVGGMVVPDEDEEVVPVHCMV